MDAIDLRTPIQTLTQPPIMSQGNFAEWCGVSRDTVRGWVQTGTLPTCKVGRQRFVDVNGFIDSLKRGKTIYQQGDYSGD